MNIYDCHTHSENSHDGNFSVEEMCRSAAKLGLKGITITDHFDCEKYSSQKDFTHIFKSIEDIAAAQKNFENEIEIYTGVEIADKIYKPETGDFCIKNGNFDFVLASLHSASTGKRISKNFESFKSFKTTTCDEDKAFLDLYYKNLLFTAKHDDFDSLAHFSYPLRYLNGWFGKGVCLDEYKKIAEEIFKILITREKSLEINTSEFKNNRNITMPDKEFITLYYSLGGRLITLGSDAHRPEHIACGFEETTDMLKEIGFDKYYFYKKRKPVPVSF